MPKTTPFIPEVGERIVPMVIEEKTVKGILNAPPVGTRIRATLGETVIVGRVGRPSPHSLIVVDIEPQPGNIYTHLTRDFSLWTLSGWTFELLTDEASE